MEGEQPNYEDMEECMQKFSEENLDYFKPLIARYRPLVTTMKNVKKCAVEFEWPEFLISRDFQLRLSDLNQYGFANIFQQFTDNGDTASYLRISKLFTMAISLEFWQEFFSSQRVTVFDMEIRNQLREARGIAISSTETASYADFKEWIHSYTPDPDSEFLYFDKFHGFRSLSPKYTVTYERMKKNSWDCVKHTLPFLQD